ncbi:MAG: glutamine-hydrolyzing carbamoyl-phosphate synthase small subunit [Vallitaleaceae bacterium]|nr:glutamine-hydrolyzing carbamoyl-phosphate synthase small subunit [Vallitaleaceae bacterium]
MKGRLYLEDGTIFEGESFGANTTLFGEIVFNTSMTGYQEILTDPSYGGQIVTMTYPLIGNYGINDVDYESDKIQVTGFVVKEYAQVPNHWQSKRSLDDYLKANNIPGISGIDTRKLTKIIRNNGTMNCIITTEEITPDLISQLNNYRFPKDIVAQVSCDTIKNYPGDGIKIALIDLGIKKGIIHQLQNLNCDITVFPHDITVDQVQSHDPDVVFFSNGPGDPKDATSAIELAKQLLGKKPMWGICLGHQVLALALGADTYKLKFGHRGANHPVIDTETGKVFMSSQNHGYAVDEKTFTDHIKVTHYNVNDETNEGLSCGQYKVLSVQFHPEEGPGPEDAHYIFEKWVGGYEKAVMTHA